MDNVVKVTSKGQITLPKRVREELGVTAGDRVQFQRQGNRIVIAREHRKSVFEEFRGIGTPGIGSGKKAVLRWVRDIRGEL